MSIGNWGQGKICNMILILLGVFLLIALISIKTIKPKNKVQIWLSSVLIPLIALSLFALIYSEGSYYHAGKGVAQCLLPALVSGFFIYSHLIKKLMEKKNNDIGIIHQKDAPLVKKLNIKQKYINDKFIKMKLKNIKLDLSETIVLSIVIGVLLALILGFTFPRYYNSWTYESEGIKIYGEYRKGSSLPEFNYFLAISGFIIISGITYLYLKKMTTLQNSSDDLEKRYNNESEK
jgi:hypothetical protein